MPNDKKYTMPIRLNAFVAKAIGISRRQADKLIKSGLVSFNGSKVGKNDLGLKVSETDVVEHKGKILSLPDFKYIALNKPPGYITTVRDRFAKFTVMDLIPSELRRLKPIGRLDKDTRGLLLLTDDGRLMHRLLHPKYGVVKEYLVKIKGRLSSEGLKQIRDGFVFSDFTAMPCKAVIEKAAMSYSIVRLFMKEGKRRQIRRMFDRLKCPVIDLKRVSFGPVKLGRLKEGDFRYLSGSEIDKLKFEE